MMRIRVQRSIAFLVNTVTAVALLTTLPVLATDDPKQLYKQCQACHAVGAGAAHGVGPHLNGLAERPAGAMEGYAYSAAFAPVAETGNPWSAEKLNAFLLAPLEMYPGTRMGFLGIKDDAERAVMVDWLLKIGADGSLPEPAIVAEAEQPTVPEVPRVPAADMPIPDHGVLHLGRVALDEEITAWDIDVRPDGQGLPAGQGTVATGGEIYDAQCATCHGVFGEGEGRWPILAGGADTLTDDRPEKTIGSYWPYLSTVYDYVKRAMPFGNARSLSDDDVYALTAYLMYLNDLVDDEEFELNADNFASVSMPNVDNFIDDDRKEEAHYAAMEEPCMSDCKPGAAEVTQRAMVLDVTPDGEGDESAAGGSID